MDAFSLDPDGPLPDDVPTLQDLVRQLLREMASLRGRLNAALRHRFGRRSERQQTRTPPVADQPRQGRHLHGRSPLPAHLERRLVVHDLAEEDKLCPCCGRPRVCIGEQTAEQLDLEPAKFFVRRTIKKSYACQHCDPATIPPEQRLQTAGPAEVGPLAKGLCGPGLLAHVITAKFADHTPVYRLAGQLTRSGVAIACSTLGGWLARAADLLKPLAELMRIEVLLSRLLHSDDTGVKLRVAGAKHTQKAHLWTYIGDADHPYVVFDFTADYTASGPTKVLAKYKGYLEADALAQYEGVFGADQVKHCCCWAHARRKFVAAVEGGDERARTAVELIGELYTIERELPPLLAPANKACADVRRRAREEQRRQLRQRRAGPLLARLKKWLGEQRGQALPKSALGQAIGYAMNNWTALCRYLKEGYLPIDNNLSERTLRAIALGRNNWIMLGSVAGGGTAAVLYTIVGTCKHLGIDPFSYLREALPGLFALGEKPAGEQLQEWLPDKWLQRRGRDQPQEQVTAG
jgi:transposase